MKIKTWIVYLYEIFLIIILIWGKGGGPYIFKILLNHLYLVKLLMSIKFKILT